MSVLVFAATQALPGDIAQMVLGRDSTPEQVDRLRSALNLDAPVWRQYLIWAQSFAGRFRCVLRVAPAGL
ncbi:hypothetical protein ACFQFQ_27800 [Sulfitobacter porphyrae]|uniref:ABC transporter type 1 GsiC-like N-terminal domain-containing protein n=1 Tax=Sulfitobacter porphyrae TaxID=1246864 RepID=A0ABW2BA61_9RHOB